MPDSITLEAFFTLPPSPINASTTNSLEFTTAVCSPTAAAQLLNLDCSGAKIKKVKMHNRRCHLLQVYAFGMRGVKRTANSIKTFGTNYSIITVKHSYFLQTKRSTINWSTGIELEILLYFKGIIEAFMKNAKHFLFTER